MSNGFWKGITEGVIENLPAILTGASVVVGVGTVGYSNWAGWKIKEITEDESIDNKQKAKKIAIISVPTVLGTVLASGCAIAAHKENSNRLAVLAAGTAGAVTLVNDETKEKILDVVDKDHKIHRAKKSEVKSNITVGSNEEIEIEDQVTGYRFKTTLSDLWFTANQFNDDLLNVIGTGEKMSIADFYERLLGEGYNACSAHELVKFGSDVSWDSNHFDKNVILSIQLDSRLDEHMSPIYTMDYDYLG